VKFFGKGKGANVNGENQADLGDLQRERDRRQTALSSVQDKINAIEEGARLAREEGERKQMEVARLQKNLATCRETIAWVEKRIADLKGVVRAQIGIVCQGSFETAFNLKSTLREIAEWELEVATFKEYEASLPKEIEKLAAPA
jgi:chromosome segregation ATPase